MAEEETARTEHQEPDLTSWENTRVRMELLKKSAYLADNETKEEPK